MLCKIYSDQYNGIEIEVLDFPSSGSACTGRVVCAVNTENFEAKGVFTKGILNLLWPESPRFPQSVP